METRWLYHRSETFPTLVEEAKGICVIPMGCVEKYDLHLPLGQDILQVSYLAHLASPLAFHLPAEDVQQKARF